MKRVICSPEQPLGALRPQHGIGNWPQPLICYADGGDRPQWEQILSLFREIDPPVTRLKYNYAGAYAKKIAVPFVFKDFRKDANDPQSYYFYQTDPAVRDTVKAGKPVIYHLGPIRENWSALYTRKPEDYEKYATVCLNMIRHLNHGWADGLHSGIAYWEIWNRPDDPHCWTGTAQDYYRLYEAVAKAVKNACPEEKVGGPGVADMGDPTFLQGFLDYVRSNDVPCDFVSWHYYGVDAAEAGRQAKLVKAMVKKAGLQVPVFNTEWNALELDEQGIIQCPDARSMKGAAFDAAFMMQMEEADMDLCTYYDGTYGAPWAALYQRAGYRTEKPIYSFAAFARLFAKENRFAVKTAGKNVYAMGAQKGDGFALLVAVCQDKRDTLALTLPAGKKQIKLLDDSHDLEPVAETEAVEFTLPLRGQSVVLVESV